jgi:hypothetical protein
MNTRLQIALLSAVAVIGLTYADSEAAVQAKGQDHNYAQVIAELHQAKHLLDHANHTYNGHRAKADHEITKAIHVLHHNHQKKGTTVHHQAPHKSESQAASDTELRHAEKLVHAAIHELEKHNHDEKAHHASKLLHEAAHEIELAIHLHHKHHAKK